MPKALLDASRSTLLLLLAIAGLALARYWGSYLMFHVLVELFSAVVLSSVFVVIWNTRRRQANGYLTLAGLASVFVAALGIVHTLAYNGMNVIPGVVGPDPATQFWIAIGGVKALTLCLAPLFVNRRINTTFVITIYTIVFSLIVVSILEWPIFPNCFVEGQGLTPFKVYAEYVISAVLVAAAVGWWFIRKRFAASVRYMLLGALATTIASELLFTLYTSVYGFWNFAGHILNMISYYLLYKAIVQSAITDPFSILLHDLKTREEQLEKHVVQLDIARKQAEEASDAKDRFLAVLSHELRTPLTPVLASVSDLLSNRGLPVHLQETLYMIQRNVELQSRLVDDLLDVTRIGRGKVRLDRSPMDVHESISNAAETCRSEYERKGVQLLLKLEATASWIDGDSARLEQVVWNLLTNARKFTPGGGRVTVLTRDVPSEPRPSFVMEVIDTGMGIEPELQSRLFTPFEQISENAARAGGLGLGLAITRAMVTLHGGEISVFSEGAGKGTTFTVTLPTIEAPRVNGHKPVANLDSVPSRSILLVEDHGDTARVVAQLLRRDGHSVAIAGDLAGARRVFADSRFDLVITDIGLPDGSGIDLLKQFRSDRPGVPAICISGFGSENDLRASAEVGTVCHLIKPITVHRLREAIREASSKVSAN